MVDYKDIIANLDLRVLAAPGRRFSGEHPVMVKCSWKEETKSSMAIYSDHIFCYGCNKRQSIMEWIADQYHLDIERDFGAVVEAATRLAGGVVIPPPPKKAVLHIPAPVILPPLDASLARKYHDQMGLKREWYLKRGLNDRIIDEQLLGHNGRAFTIPVWHPSGELLTIRFRRDDTIRKEGAKYWGIESRNDTLLFNEITLKDNYDYVCVCEGELDCLRLKQEGIPAISSTNGAGGILRLWESIQAKVLCWRIIIALDQDDAGRTSAGELRRMICGTGRSAAQRRGMIMKWDKRRGKDITELAQHSGVEYIKQLIGEIIHGEEK